MSRIYPTAVAASLAVAALSLLASTALTYDPWAWLVWGREVAHLELDTTAGPAWKPLPVALTTLLSGLGDAAPEAWLVVARAGGVLAVVLVARIAYRASERNRLLAAAFSALALLAVVGFARGVVLGSSEGLLIALAAAAYDRHLDGHRAQAFVLGVAAALLRPEVWPFLGVYAVRLARRGELGLLAAAAAAIAIPVLWFAPDAWGSGDLLRSADRARVPNPGAPTLADVPSLDVVKSFVLMLSPLMLAAVLARGATARALAAAASAWVAVVAVLSELGYSGEERYLLPAAAAVAALAGIGAARGLRSRRVTAVALAAAVVATAPFSVIAARELVADVRDDAGLQHGLARAVAASGGADALRCGSIAAGRYRFPLVAWHLHSSIADVDFAARRGVVLRSRLRRNSPLEPPRPGARFNRVATAGGWEVWSTCA